MKNIALEFKNVSFSYDKKEVLKNISFCIKEKYDIIHAHAYIS